jgi:DGQHR domain-containing protein
MKLKAIPVTQKGKTLYVSRIPAKDLIQERMFTVAKWKHGIKDPDKQGYQRDPSSTHAKRVASYLAEEGKPHRNVLPGAVLINSRDSLKTHPNKDGSVDIEIRKYPAFVVDGQHRIAGIKHAIEELGEKELEKYELPVVVSEFDLPEETLHFKTINKTAKPVSPELGQRLLRALRVQHGYDYDEDKDAWTSKALAALDQLNETPGSIWYGRVGVPGKKKEASHIAKQNSFISSLKPLYGKNARFADEQTTVDQAVKILSDYWSSLAELMPNAFSEPKEYLIQRTPGLFSLHQLLVKILQYKPAPSKEELKSILKKMMDSMEMEDDFWRRGTDRDAAVYGSMRGFTILYEQMARNLPPLI